MIWDSQVYFLFLKIKIFEICENFSNEHIPASFLHNVLKPILGFYK